MAPCGPLDLLKRWLALPGALDADLDDPATTEARVALIQRKPFLRKLYLEWYARLAAASVGVPPGKRVELGAGGGFLKRVMPEVVTTDVLALRHVDAVCRAEMLPFAADTVSAFYLVNVFHHLPAVEAFLAEVQRCLVPGGRLIMIEPWNTPWSRLVYTRLHHEPFRPDDAWSLDAENRPLSAANGALPWIVFGRDREQLAKHCAKLRVISVKPMMPLAYLLSGGVSMRALAPGWAYGLIRGAENLTVPINRFTVMFAEIVVEKER